MYKIHIYLWCFVEVFHAAVVSHFMFVSPLTYCAHLSNYQVPSLNTKSFVSPRDLTGQSLIDFQGLALSKNAKSLWFFMFHLFLCVMSDQTWVQSLNPKAFGAVTRQAVKKAILCCVLDVLCGQQIKLFQVVSTSEFHEY